MHNSLSLVFPNQSSINSCNAKNWQQRRKTTLIKKKLRLYLTSLAVMFASNSSKLVFKKNSEHWEFPYRLRSRSSIKMCITKNVNQANILYWYYSTLLPHKERIRVRYFPCIYRPDEITSYIINYLKIYMCHVINFKT